MDFKLFHNTVTVNLDGSLRFTKRVRDLLVEFAANDKLKDFSFPWRQLRNQVLQIAQSILPCACLCKTRECRFNSCCERILRYRLG